MREILFRGKTKDGKWVEGSLVKYTHEMPDKKEEHFRIQETIYGFNDDSNMPFFCDYMCGVDEDVIPETIGQYTGLCDKNGNKIFEGDIVKYTFDLKDNPYQSENGQRERVSSVFWQEWRASWSVYADERKTKCCNNDLFHYIRNGNRVEVIGNIHDNPELLEVER